jgi:hypothetical protein
MPYFVILLCLIPDEFTVIVKGRLHAAATQWVKLVNYRIKLAEKYDKNKGYIFQVL